jgi:predicted molibdopterin-dependent oxidoreductase YjgC
VIHTFTWAGQTVLFHPGESIVAALIRSGQLDFGPAHGGLRLRYFCGVGACQCCLVSVDGASPVEACLTPAQAGTHLSVAMPFAEQASDE